MSDEIQKKQIIDYTSTTTLANGDKLLLQKADGTTMNVDYTELARNIITQYNAQTLAGSAQSIQSAFAALNSKLTNSIIQVTWGTEATFTLAINHRFVAFVAANCVYTGINYSDRLTCNQLLEGGEGITMSATRDETTVKITTNKAANIGILTF